MKRTALFFAALAVSVTACDNDAEPTNDPRVAEYDLAEDDADDEAPEGRRHGKRGMRGHPDPSAEICEAVTCTDTQREQVRAAFARPERPARDERPERPDMSAANATLATAFASSNFSESDLQAWAAQLPERPERPDRGAERADTLSELHTIFTASQREVLASKIEAGEVFGHGPKGRGKGKRGPEGEEAREGEKASRRVEGFCEPLSCSDAQKAELAAIFESKHEGRPNSDEKRAALAAAFRADTFDTDALPERKERGPGEMNSSIVEIHGVLTAEQRATVAERIEERGPKALMGRGGKHHGHHGKKRGGPKSRHEKGQ